MLRSLRRAAAVIAAFALVLGSAACHARQLRAAQDGFNEAARAESDPAALRTSAGTAIYQEGQVVAAYRESVRLVDEELKHHEQALRDDGLLGNAIVLRGLCLWRLADLQGDATTSAQLMDAVNASAFKDVAYDPRDGVLLAALPGLRDHDIGRRRGAYDGARASFRSAHAVLAKALALPDVPPDHPVRTYLLLADLRVARSYLAANYRLHPAADQADAQEANGWFNAALAKIGQLGDPTEAVRAEIKALCSAMGISIPEFLKR